MDTVKHYIKYFVLAIALLLLVNIGSAKAATDVILKFTDAGIEETVSGSGYIINGTSLEIINSGTYIIKGSCTEGNISVKKGTTGVTIVLEDLQLSSSKTAPITVKKDGAQVDFWLNGHSVIVDNEDPSQEFSPDPEVADLYEGAAIKVKSGSSVSFAGAGIIDIESRHNNAIKGASEASITFNTGIFNISAGNSGVSCDGTITLNNGHLTIDAANEGIKLSPNEDDTTSLAKFVNNGGKVVISAGQDGIQAQGDIEINGWSEIEIDSKEDAIQTRSNFTMTNGRVVIHTFEGYNTPNFDPDIMSAKGIKAAKTDEQTEDATNTINITGGTIYIDSSDDAIHSDAYVNITRGTVTALSGDDGIHADTKLVIGSQGGLSRDPEITIRESVEGIEAGNIYVYSGKTSVYAIDDGMNAAGGASSGGGKEHGEHFNPDTGQMEENYAIYVYGGNIYVNCEGDGLDANGSLYLYGGTQIIYHQDAQGNNSALDRDHKLVIDGATVFAAGGVADNGRIDSTGSSQKIIIDDTTDYSANSKVVVSDNGTPVFNDQIPKRSVYTFYSSPSLDNGSISTTSTIADLNNNPWNHNFDDGVITTPATPSTPGVITYTCQDDGYTESKTYFYKGEVTFTFVNKTNGQASITVGSTTSSTNFVTNEPDEFIYMTTTEDVELIATKDGLDYQTMFPESTSDPNTVRFHANPSTTKTFYVVLDGDVNMDGVADIDDSTIIARSLLSSSDPRYVELSLIQKVLADINDDGLINSHDGLAIIKDLTGTDKYDESYFGITSIDPVILDGEHDGEATVSFYTKKAIFIDAMDGRYSPSKEYPSTNGYLELSDIQGSYDQVQYSLIDVNSGFAGAVDTNGLSIPKDTVLVTLKYKVDKDTPTGTYPVKLRIDSVTAHDSKIPTSFEIKADVIVKGQNTPTSAFFVADDGVAGIDVYHTQDYSHSDEVDVTSTAIRDSVTGELIPPGGEGQLNFLVKPKMGYIVTNVEVTPSAHFKQVKGPADTDQPNTFRVTKVTGDIEVVVTTKKASEFTATFDIDENKIEAIDVYYTQDYTTPDETGVTETLVRNGDTGAIDISGDGQVNFKVIPKPGYKVDSVKVSGTYKNIKDQGNNIYRVTKVSGDIIIKVKGAEKETIVPEVTGYSPSHVYTGSKIKPAITVNIAGTETTLVKNTDYTIEYGTNKDVGTGTITINPVMTSAYLFNPTTVTFDITPYTLTSSNVEVPSAIVYTGDPLSPEVTVTHGSTTLVEGTDYEVSYANQDGMVGESVNVIVTGKGNFTGVVNDKEVPITAKATQTIVFEHDEITKIYGSDFTQVANLVVGDGTITYSSSNPAAATVDPVTGAVTLVATGQTYIRATASETENYAETTVRYKLIVKKADIAITGVTVSDKDYDGTKTATVTGVTFSGLVKSEELVMGTDYTVTGLFSDAEIGTDKEVTVTVDLSVATLSRYALANNTAIGTASINPISITENDITLSDSTYEYDGTEKTPTVSVVTGGQTLVENVDYKVSYIDNVNEGEAYAVIVGIGNYSTNTPITKVFTITPKTITPTIEAIEDQEFTGSEVQPAIVVKDGTTTLVEGTDYTVSYANNIVIGTADVTISPVDGGNYTFDDTDPSASTTFDIVPYTIKEEDITLEYTFVKYDGSAKTPSVTVTLNGNVLTENTDYTVAYSNNNVVTETAKVTVTGLAPNYTGTPEVFFEISDKDLLTISGINNQSVTYTGEEVELEGTLTVSENTDNITADDLTVKYYDSSDNEIERPTNVGAYYVVYSYDGANYKGETRVDFEITKKESSIPSEVSSNLQGVVHDSLNTIVFTTSGLAWEDGTTSIAPESNTYPAIYTENNDTINYTTINVNIPVYGKQVIDINTSVDGAGGTITDSMNDVVEGTPKTITLDPNEGYEVDAVYINNEEVPVSNNQLEITAGSSDMNIVVKFKTTEYSMNISGDNSYVDPYGIINVEHNSAMELTISAKPGYRLSSVKVNNEEKITDLTSDKLTVGNITDDTKVSATAERITYEVIEGARQEYVINRDTYARFVINADYDLFETGGKVLVDEKEVDAKYYTSESGSTVIVFNREFMDSLSLGAHSFRVEFNDGGEASCTFRVALLKYQDKEDIVNPTTGDTITKVINIFIISLIVIIGIILIANRKTIKKLFK